MKTEMTSHFAKLVALWRELELPLRPLEPVPSAVAAHLPDRAVATLMLGVTPDYANLSDDLTAVDWSRGMISHIWPGDTPRRRAVEADWRDLPFPDASFGAAIGDNSLAMLRFPDDVDAVLCQVRRVLRPGGVAIFRWFIAPDRRATDDELRGFGMRGCSGSIEALRWRLVMHRVHETGGANVIAGQAYETYARLFPDRDALCAAHGWSEAELARVDVYRGSDVPFSFPTRGEMLELAARHFGSVALASSGEYPMSDMAPLVVMRAPCA